MDSYLDADALVERVTELQPLPEAATRVIQTAEAKGSSAGHLAAIIGADQALTARLLRLANSAYYGHARGVGTVRDAVVLLGLREVKSIAMATAVAQLFEAEPKGPFNIDLFWGHAVATALVAESLAKETGQVDTEKAYTAGLLHDIGKLVLNQYMPREYAAAVETAMAHALPIHTAEQRVFGFTHAALGAKLADRWQFPQELVEAIGGHHRANIQADRAPLTYITSRANGLCHERGLYAGFEYDSPPPERFSLDTADPLRAAVLHRLGGMHKAEERARQFVGTTVRRNFAWYSRARRDAEPAPVEANVEVDDATPHSASG